MKINILFLYIVFLLFVKVISAQCVSVELSVKWDKGYDVFHEDSIICIPMLCITYRNNSNNSYYFLKVSNSRLNSPIFSSGTFLQYPYQEYLHPDYMGRALRHSNYSNQKYRVIIWSSPLYNSGWFIEKDTFNTDTERVIDYINDELANIYEYTYRKSCAEHLDSPKMTKVFFSASEITPRNILGAIRDRFVFLKPGEIYSDTFNIIGFKMLKGCYTFYIDQNTFLSYVNSEPKWDKSLSKYIDTIIPLPPEVEGYKLYSGSFNSNKVVITF